MSTYGKAGTDLQKEMGAALWGAVIGIVPTKTTWNKLLKDLRPIIIFGYKSATPQVKKLYREVMAMEGLTFK